MAFVPLRVLPRGLARVAYPRRAVCFYSTAAEHDIRPIDALPGPKRLPIFGTILQSLLAGLRPGAKPLGKRLLEQQFQRHDRYGKIVRNQIGNVSIVELADPRDVETIFRAEPKYPRRFDIPLLTEHRIKRGRDPLLFFANDEEWYKHRSVIGKPLLRPEEVAEYADPFNETITDFVVRLREIRGAPGTIREYELLELDNELFKWSFESVAELLFGRRFGCLSPKMHQQAREFIGAVALFLDNLVVVALVPPSFYKIYKTRRYKDFVSSYDKMYELAEVFIGEKLKEMEGKERTRVPGGDADGERLGFLEFLLSSDRLTKDDLVASVVGLLIGGVDTTSNTLQWTLYLLAKNPDKQARLYEEVIASVTPGTLPDVNSLARMPYLKACIQETLRLYPVLPTMSRTLPYDIVLHGYKIPANTQVQFSMYYMSRSEEFFPEAAAFKPERWLRETRRARQEALSAFASIPFGFGTRMCVGRRVAELEMHLMLARLVLEFQLGYPPGEELEPTVRGVTIPDRPVRVTFEDRRA